jgi:uncharacterized Zn finger protein (UPF0148 family)
MNVIMQTKQEDGYKWWQGEVVCSICGHTQTSRIEIPKDAQEPIVLLECSECHNMSCQVE